MKHDETTVLYIVTRVNLLDSVFSVSGGLLHYHMQHRLGSFHELKIVFCSHSTNLQRLHGDAITL